MASIASEGKPGRSRFAESHARLAAQVAPLAARAGEGGAEGLAIECRAIATGLQRHFEAEDEQLLPKFRAVNANEAALLDGHRDSIRASFAAVEAEAERGSVRAESVEILAAALRAYSRREEKVFYPWAESRLLGWVWSKAAERLEPRDARSKR
jgi:hypothetical protein